MSKGKKVGAYIILAVLFGVYLFMETPNLNPLYKEGAFIWCAAISIVILVSVLIRSYDKIKRGGMSEATVVGADGKPAFAVGKVVPKWAKIVLIGVWTVFFIVIIASSVFFNWKAYRDQLKMPEAQQFNDKVQPVDSSQIPIVDKELARQLADRNLGAEPSLGSQVNLGEPVIQMVNGKLVWVVPLHHSGFFKWLTNMDGTPGYIVVSATNDNDVKYVDSYKVKYQENNFFMDDVKRKVRFGKGLFEGITDMSFELDDSGQPYWVVTTYKNLRGFALPEADGVIILNATTGEMQKYDMSNIPEWVDRVQPENFIMQQIYNNGRYIRGIFNFSDKDKYKPSPGSAIIYNNGECYLFTGLTSVGGDEAAIGFTMVNMVTKEPLYYRMSGATENVAQGSAEGKVQHLGYKATSPILLNIDGEPTYFMSLKDNERLIKQYAFVNVKKYSIVGAGETVDTALRDYQKNINNAGINNSNISGDAKPSENKILEGKVTRIASELQGENTVYKFMIEGNDTIFLSLYDLSAELALTNVGDNVKITYVKSDEPLVTVNEFDNKSIGKSEVTVTGENKKG